MKKWITLIIVAVAVAGVVLVSRNQKESSVRPQSKVKLKFAHIWSTEQEVVRENLDEFERENPHIVVEDIVMPSEEYKIYLKTTIQSGEGPDVFFMWTTDLKEYKDVAADLTPFFEDDPAWRDSFIPAYLGMTRWPLDGGQWYGVPFRTTSNLLFYNKEMFESLGLEEPQTWSQFLAVLKTLKESKVVEAPLVIAATQDSAFGTMNLGMFVQFALAEGKYEAYVNGLLPSTDGVIVKPLKLLKELYDKGYLLKGSFNLSYEEAALIFKHRRAAFLYTNSNAYGFTFKSIGLDFPVGVMSVPNPTTYPEPVVMGGVDTFMVKKGTPYPKEAVLLLKFLTSRKVQQQWLDEMNMGVVVKGTKFADPVLKELSELGGYTSRYRDFALQSSWNQWPWKNTLDARWVAYMEGKITLKEFVNELERVRLGIVKEWEERNKD